MNHCFWLVFGLRESSQLIKNISSFEGSLNKEQFVLEYLDKRSRTAVGFNISFSVESLFKGYHFMQTIN